jgi:hypothetical protein
VETSKPYNPLAKANLGRSIAQKLLEQPLSPLPPERFAGAGVYALYYAGDFPAYRRISLKHAGVQPEIPIYVGKAIATGGRKGNVDPDETTGTYLYSRLRSHVLSIKRVENLELADFRCRYLVVDEVFIGLGERLAICEFRPVWNVMIDGFGNNKPGKGRDNTERPRWDTLHPGRQWATALRPRAESQEQLIASVDDFLLRLLEHKVSELELNMMADREVSDEELDDAESNDKD